MFVAPLGHRTHAASSDGDRYRTAELAYSRSMAALKDLRQWLTLEEAAQRFAEALSEEVSAADVLRLAIDGKLTLSLYLPVSVSARCRRPDDDSGGERVTTEKIDGLCD